MLKPPPKASIRSNLKSNTSTFLGQIPAFRPPIVAARYPSACFSAGARARPLVIQPAPNPAFTRSISYVLSTASLILIAENPAKSEFFYIWIYVDFVDFVDSINWRDHRLDGEFFGKMTAFQLLGAGEKPVGIENANAPGDVLLVCEHASRLLPERLGSLGLDQAALESHIAWDPGALELSRRLSTELDAVLYHQRFSRLVYDCNRPHDAPSAIVTTSESYAVPGNRDISPEERSARINEIYVPFREGLASLIRRRNAVGRSTVLVTIHSFTRVYFGRTRDVEVGILHARDSRIADEIMREAEHLPPKYIVRRNEPYGPADGVTHTLIEHGIKNNLPNVMIEVRNDLLRNDADHLAMAAFLAPLIKKAISALQHQGGAEHRNAAAKRPNN